MIETSAMSVAALLRWYLDAGVDETIGERPLDRYRDAAGAGEAPDAAGEARSSSAPAADGEPRTDRAAPSVRAPSARAPAAGPVAGAVHLASRATSLDQLRQALSGFDGCPLSGTATNLVFGDGNPAARIVFIGEAPGAEEDLRGLPFVGPSGRLLDQMLASIGLDRTRVFISNTVFWRPPGNRNPSTTEVATCMPFVERMLELIDPVLLVALGGPAASALLGQKESVGRLRGRVFSYQTAGLSRPVRARVMYHPAYLLRTPAQKRLAWRDLLALKQDIEAAGPNS
ncbi:MAG: uracil-DNA glycosylase [Rhodospirillales bacterium]